jgi:hypothetical protein
MLSLRAKGIRIEIITSRYSIASGSDFGEVRARYSTHYLSCATRPRFSASMHSDPGCLRRGCAEFYVEMTCLDRMCATAAK